jgi:hypothetical protein
MLPYSVKRIGGCVLQCTGDLRSNPAEGRKQNVNRNKSNSNTVGLNVQAFIIVIFMKKKIYNAT